MYNLPDELRVESDGPVRIVTLNRPNDRNCASTEMLFALTELAKALRQDDDARAVVVTGAGKAFSAGGDFQHLIRSTREPDHARATLDNSRTFLNAMMDLPLPVVAAVNGAAVGFGATLAAVCDIVLIAEDAFLAEPHVNIGLAVGDGISVTWPFFMSLLKAKEYIFTGDKIPAAEAVALGLANRAMPREDLMPEAMKLAHRLALQPPTALAASKGAMNLYMKSVFHTVLENVLENQCKQIQSQEHGSIVQGLIDRQARNRS